MVLITYVRRIGNTYLQYKKEWRRKNPLLPQSSNDLKTQVLLFLSLDVEKYTTQSIYLRIRYAA
jgi:hypothetical protein